MKKSEKACRSCGGKVFLWRGWKARGHDLCRRCWRSSSDSMRAEGAKRKDPGAELDALSELLVRLGPFFAELEAWEGPED